MSHSFLFRADASLEIGTGHVMRCLSLAVALRNRGARCAFACREQPGEMSSRIRSEGFVVDMLPSGHIASAQEFDLAQRHLHWQDDAHQTGALLAERPADWLVVDHYALDRRWESALRAPDRRLLAIDDLADRAHDVDMLIDSNPGRNTADYDGLLDPHATLLTGPRYALLRPEFASLREASLAKPRRTGAGHLLLAMGGTDVPNATGRVLEALSCLARPPAAVTVVLGAKAPWLPAVRAQAPTMPFACEVIADAKEMAELMYKSDVAIGAAGGGALERCCVGLPSIIVVLAENQRRGASFLDRAGAARTIHSVADIGLQLPAILEELRALGLLDRMSELAAGLVDGLGTARVIDALEAL